MTQNSPAGRGPVAERLAYKLRDLTDRVRVLELRRFTSVSIGHWRITEASGGDLVAIYTPNGASYTLATVPEET